MCLRSRPAGSEAKRWRCRDIDIGPWQPQETGDRGREVAFTARIHDPPLGAGRTAKCIASQLGRLHSDGTFSLDVSQVRCHRAYACVAMPVSLVHSSLLC